MTNKNSAHPPEALVLIRIQDGAMFDGMGFRPITDYLPDAKWDAERQGDTLRRMLLAVDKHRGSFLIALHPSSGHKVVLFAVQEVAVAVGEMFADMNPGVTFGIRGLAGHGIATAAGIVSDGPEHAAFINEHIPVADIAAITERCRQRDRKE